MTKGNTNVFNFGMSQSARIQPKQTKHYYKGKRTISVWMKFSVCCIILRT